MSSDHQEVSNDSVLDDLAPGLDRSLHRQYIRGIFVLWFIMTVLGVLAGLYLTPILMPHMNSPEGRAAVKTVIVFTVAAAPVAALVCAVALYSLLHTRHRGSLDHPPADGPPLRGNALASGVWLITSTLLVVFLLFWGLTEWSAQQVVHADSLTINVIGQQWIWDYNLPAQTVRLPGGRELKIPKELALSKLNLPVDVPVTFNVTSKDVTHGFWPVNLGIQVDANPGQRTVIRTVPDRLGKFVVRCSQLCGLNHAYMYTQAQVVPDQDFQAWVQGGARGPILAVASSQNGSTK